MDVNVNKEDLNQPLVIPGPSDDSRGTVPDCNGRYGQSETRTSLFAKMRAAFKRKRSTDKSQPADETSSSNRTMWRKLIPRKDGRRSAMATGFGKLKKGSFWRRLGRKRRRTDYSTDRMEERWESFIELKDDLESEHRQEIEVSESLVCSEEITSNSLPSTSSGASEQTSLNSNEGASSVCETQANRSPQGTNIRQPPASMRRATARGNCPSMRWSPVLDTISEGDEDALSRGDLAVDLRMNRNFLFLQNVTVSLDTGRLLEYLNEHKWISLGVALLISSILNAVASYVRSYLFFK